MPGIVWDESLKLGIREIDEQHERLIRYVNDLYVSMKEGKAKERAAMILEDLTRYAEVHFDAEERLMRLHDFPDFALHKLEHGNFVNKVNRLTRDFSGRQVSVTLDLMHFLRDWVTNHIKNTDRKYAPFLKKKGVS